jgi:hypothetical protein
MDHVLQKWAPAQLARCVLNNAIHLNWSIQGFGMLRAYLSKETRLHIWHSSGKVDNVSTIHDHPWDFDSYVIAGQITDVVYREKENTDPFTHVKQRIRCGEGGCALDQQFLARLAIVESRTYFPGEMYSRKATDLHESIPADGTITLIRRRFNEDTEHAWVCFPIGTEWVSAEPRKATPEEVERFVGAGLSALDAVK